MPTNRPKRSKKQINYTENVINWTYKLKEPFITWFGIQYHAGKQFKFQNMNQCFILEILEYEILDGISRLICNVITKKGVVKNAILNKDDIPFEYWISSVRGRETKLILNGWLFESEPKKYKLNKNYSPKYSKGDVLYHTPIYYCQCGRRCECPPLPKWVKCKILEVKPHIYMGELSCEYRIQVYSRNGILIKGGWTSGAQLFLCEPTQYHSWVKFEDVIIDILLKCRKYIIYTLLPKSEQPLYVQRESGYYLKIDQFIRDIGIIEVAQQNKQLFESNLFHHLYIAELNYILDRSFKQTIKPSILPKQRKHKATKNNLIKFATHYPPFNFDFKLKPFLKLYDIEFTGEQNYIQFRIALNKIHILNRNDIIYKLQDKAEVKLISDLVFRFVHKTNELMLYSFTYSYLNHHVTNLNEREADNEEKQQENDELFDVEMQNML